MVGIILDVIIVAIIALNVYFCYKKGIVNLAVWLIAHLAEIILAIIFYQPVSNLIIENTELDENIENAIIENFAAEVPEGAEVRYVGLLDYLEKYVDDAINKTQNEIVYESAGTIAVKIINVIALLGIFLIVRIALFALTFVADAITSLPILKQLDDVGGILYGLIKGLLIIYVVLAIVFFVVNVTANITISDAISSSYVTKFFYERNIILNILF